MHKNVQIADETGSLDEGHNQNFPIDNDKNYLSEQSDVRTHFMTFIEKNGDPFTDEIGKTVTLLPREAREQLIQDVTSKLNEEKALKADLHQRWTLTCKLKGEMSTDVTDVRLYTDQVEDFNKRIRRAEFVLRYLQKKDK